MSTVGSDEATKRRSDADKPAPRSARRLGRSLALPTMRLGRSGSAERFDPERLTADGLTAEAPDVPSGSGALALPVAYLLLAAAMPTLSSCTAPGPTPADYGARSLVQQDRAAVLDAAEVALVEAGFTIERRDAAEGVVISKPIEGAPVDDRISSRRRTRRVAEVQVGQRGQTLTAYCKVEIQELATQGYRMFAQERATSDSPGENTPINRDAATTTEQNTVWRTVRRDKPAERRILDSIVANTGGDVAPGK